MEPLLSRTFALIFAALFAPGLLFAAPPEPFRVGAIAPLSGDFAAYGNHIREGIELARESLRTDGIETRALYEDACLPKDARSAAERLIHSGRIQGLVGSYCVVGMVPSAPLFEAAGVPAFHTSEVPRSLLNAASNVFTTNARIHDESRVLAEYAVTGLRAKRVAVLSLTTQWGQEFGETFSMELEKLGGEVVAHESTPIGQNEFRAELTRFKARNPEALLIVHLGGTLASAIIQAKNLGLNVPLLTASDAEEDSVLAAAKGAAEGLTLFAPEPAQKSAAMKDFDSRFRKKYGRDAHPLARHSFDATILTARALDSCKGDEPCAARILSKTKNFPGASGPISIDADRATSREFVKKLVRGNKFERSTGSFQPELAARKE